MTSSVPSTNIEVFQLIVNGGNVLYANKDWTWIVVFR